jgi:hypothetical protein
MELEKQDEISGDEIVDEEIILSPTEIIANELKERREYKYKDIVYKIRNKNWKKYRIPAIKFSRKYTDFENQYIPKDLRDKVDKLYSDKNLIKLVDKTNKKDKVNEEVMDKFLESSGDVIIAMSKIKLMKNEIVEDFFLENENAKELCNIVYENSESINYEPDGGQDDYDEYFNFIKGTFSFFLMMSRPTTNILGI